MNSDTRLEQAKQVPLQTIVDAYQLTRRTRNGVTHYEGNGIDIVLTGGSVWYDNVARIESRGAVDLALHLRGIDPRSAKLEQREAVVDWINHCEFLRSPAEAVGQGSSFPGEAAQLAIRDDDRWPMARRYLIDTCRVPSHVVDLLHRQEHLYASYGEHQPEITDLCFLRHDMDGIPQGATLQSTIDPREVPRSIGNHDAWFSLRDPECNRFILTENPIDAISYMILNRPEAAAILAMPSREVPATILETACGLQWGVIVAFGNGPSAHDAYAQCRRDWEERFGPDHLPRRIAPLGCTWNDDLRAAKTLSRDHKW